MIYTPRFQLVIDEVERMAANGTSIGDIRSYFFNACQELGAEERLNNLYRIRGKRASKGAPSKIIQFKMNRMQRAFYQKRTTRDLVLKMRQGGVTTFSCLIALDMALFENDVNTAIMAHILPNVKKYFRICKLGFQQFQKDWGDLYPVSSKLDNVNELVINETGSSLSVCMEAKGLTLDFLHISEAAFVDDDRISESIEAVPLSSWVILETTPDTASGYFYDCWDEWYKGSVSMFTGHFFPWWHQYPEDEDLGLLQPDDKFQYTDEERLLVELNDLTPQHIIWRRLKISESKGDKGEFMRKYPEDASTCFLSGSNSVFPADVLGSLIANERVPAFVGDLVLSEKRVKFQARDYNPANLKVFCGLRMWAKPKEGRRYAIGADVAEGVGKDASVAQVIDVDNGDTVAVYWSNTIDVDNYAAELVKMGKFYNMAYICVEQNNHGNGVIAHLGGSGLRYPKLYRRVVLDEYTTKRTKVIGFKTTQNSKPRIIENLKSALRDGDLTTQDKHTIQELNSFVRDERTGRMAGKGTTKDDRVMAFALAWEQARVLRMINKEVEYRGEVHQAYDPSTGFPI